MKADFFLPVILELLIDYGLHGLPAIEAGMIVIIVKIQIQILHIFTGRSYEDE
jgi:hypothetical protein